MKSKLEIKKAYLDKITKGRIIESFEDYQEIRNEATEKNINNFFCFEVDNYYEVKKAYGIKHMWSSALKNMVWWMRRKVVKKVHVNA